MARINLTLDEEIFEKLQQRTQAMGNDSLSGSARELIESGLLMEEMSGNPVVKNENTMGILEQMMVKNLIWLLETRFLLRFMARRLPDMNDEKCEQIFNTYSEKAVNHVNEMLGKKKK
jgi:hypothetical protein